MLSRRVKLIGAEKYFLIAARDASSY